MQQLRFLTNSHLNVLKGVVVKMVRFQILFKLNIFSENVVFLLLLFLYMRCTNLYKM